MQLDRPLLTIAIPTYNRRDCLTQLLEVLMPQLDGETRVQLVISDNASGDDTPAVVESFRNRGLQLLYNRNENNLGADGNFIRCYEIARGEYVWIFGDDDILVPGGLHQVLTCLGTREYDLLYLRATGFQSKYQESHQTLFSGKVRCFATPEDFALYAFTHLTFISANISRKATLESVPHEDFSKLVGTSLVQLSWTFSLLKNNARCAVLLDRVVANRTDNGGDHGTCEVFGSNLKAIVKEYFGTQSSIGSAILNRTIQGFFPWAMLQRRRNKNSRHLPEDPVTILRGIFGNNPRYWIFLHPVLRLPVPLAGAWVILGKVVNRMDGILGYPLSR
jgi:abequosyltransferase